MNTRSFALSIIALVLHAGLTEPLRANPPNGGRGWNRPATGGMGIKLNAGPSWGSGPALVGRAGPFPHPPWRGSQRGFDPGYTRKSRPTIGPWSVPTPPPIIRVHPGSSWSFPPGYSSPKVHYRPVSDQAYAAPATPWVLTPSAQPPAANAVGPLGSTTTRPTLTPNPVRPLANPIKPRPPKQNSPLHNLVWEASPREAKAYEGLLMQYALSQVDWALDRCGKSLRMVPIRKQLGELRELIVGGASSADAKRIIRNMLASFPSTPATGGIQQFQTVLYGIGGAMIARDACTAASAAATTSRGSAVAPGGVPTGRIWVIRDPALPLRTGLLLGDRILACGGGSGREISVEFSSAAACLQLPVASGTPVPDVAGEEVADTRKSIVISNPQGNLPVNYVLNQRYPFSIDPGLVQRLKGDQTWTIEFDRGSGAEAARYSLSAGAYAFQLKQQRWELLKQRFSVTLDNRDGVAPFQYLADHQIQSIQPGESKTHQSTTPIVVEFDRGEESPDARKQLNKSGVYKIAVDISTNTLDLFAQSSEPEARSNLASSAEPGRIDTGSNPPRGPDAAWDWEASQAVDPEVNASNSALRGQGG